MTESGARSPVPGRRKWQALAVAAVVVVVVAIGVQLARKNPAAPTVPAAPSSTRPTSATAPAPPASSPSGSSKPSSASSSSRPAPAARVGEAVAVYYLGDTGTRVALYREWHNTTARDHVRAALELMLNPPFDPDYTTLWPAGTRVRGVTVQRDLATVDLSAEVLQGGVGGSGSACQMLRQLVWTVTAADPKIHEVALTVEGRAEGVVSQWWGVGCGRDVPMVRATSSQSDEAAPVQISTYNEGDAVRSRFSFGGEAAVFEGAVSWSVVDAAGTVLARGSAHASKGAPARGLWQANVVLQGVKPGVVVQLRAWEASAKDGSVTNLDTKNVTIIG
jgi:germination protein M